MNSKIITSLPWYELEGRLISHKKSLTKSWLDNIHPLIQQTCWFAEERSKEKSDEAMKLLIVLKERATINDEKLPCRRHYLNDLRAISIGSANGPNGILSIQSDRQKTDQRMFLILLIQFLAARHCGFLSMDGQHRSKPNQLRSKRQDIESNSPYF